MNLPFNRGQRLTSTLSLACVLSLVLIAKGCGAEVPAAPSSTSTKEAVQPAPAPVPAPAPTPATTGAKLRFYNLRYDFGPVDDTDELKYEFKFKNEGNEELQIFEVKPSCGCTTTGLKKMSYEPGEEGAIELLFHPKGYGPQTKTITVKSNSGGSERIILYINSTVTPFVQFEPRSVRFDEVPSAEGRQEDVTMTCRDKSAVFGNPQCTNPNFTVEWIEPPVNGTGKFRVSLKAGAPKGNVINKVKIDVQGVPKAGAAAIRHAAEFSASAAVFGAIIIEPVFLSVGRVDPGGNVDKSVVLKRPKGEPFRVLTHELKNATPSNLTLSVTQSGNTWVVRVQGASGTYQGLVRGSVVITTDVPGDPRLTIPVMGAVRPDPKK
jgi:hypothetical protein